MRRNGGPYQRGVTGLRGAVTATGALVVLSPEADVAVETLRRRLDPSRRHGMPAHITVLAPFPPAAAIDDETLTALAAVAARHPAFDYVLCGVGWFGEQVVYLRPEPSSPFRELTKAVAERFPGHPPYGGLFEEIVPHLTVAAAGRWRRRAGALRRAAGLAEALGPLAARADEVSLMELAPRARRWQRAAAFPLAAPLAVRPRTPRVAPPGDAAFNLRAQPDRGGQ